MSFSHQKLDVYRLSLEYIRWVYACADDLTGIHRHARDNYCEHPSRFHSILLKEMGNSLHRTEGAISALHVVRPWNAQQFRMYF